MSIKAPGGEPYRYKLTLEVEEGGTRAFSASGSFSSREDLSAELAYDIGRMLGILDEPPTAADLVVAAGHEHVETVLGMVAVFFQSFWTYERPFDDCIRLLVDVEKLCEGNPLQAEAARDFIRASPFAEEIKT